MVSLVFFYDQVYLYKTTHVRFHYVQFLGLLGLISWHVVGMLCVVSDLYWCCGGEGESNCD